MSGQSFLQFPQCFRQFVFRKFLRRADIGRAADLFEHRQVFSVPVCLFHGEHVFEEGVFEGGLHFFRILSATEPGTIFEHKFHLDDLVFDPELIVETDPVPLFFSGHVTCFGKSHTQGLLHLVVINGFRGDFSVSMFVFPAFLHCVNTC